MPTPIRKALETKTEVVYRSPSTDQLITGQVLKRKRFRVLVTYRLLNDAEDVVRTRWISKRRIVR